MTCPIGIPGIDSKQPAVIAASVAAQLLQVREARQAVAGPCAGGDHPLSSFGSPLVSTPPPPSAARPTTCRAWN
jgi:hypothetical protein